ncbi:helix-turn-helix domain-containing protein [Clostridium paridis]|uniref:DNA binding domain-containing protein n=1 Tax=Clostridium paridis TaxID=2803863 RepID=A0A937FHP7_9CLOT|nr:RNA-binding domain-containing protein [Clostridium paridis]MBL4933939.1 putative DNA binding domain-containing protein [Clostridium paridis]
MDRRKLMTLIKQEEGIKLDFKQKIDISSDSGKKELAKDICAIANSKGGRGYLIVGIEDKTKKIIGIDKDYIFSEEQIQQIVASRCETPIPIKVDFFEIEKKYIGVITIYDGQQKPYQIRENGAFYIRRGSTTDVMRKEELLSAFQENLNIVLESFPLIRSNISALNMNLVNKYFQKKGIIINDENKEFLLESASIIVRDGDSDNYFCSLGGLLVFSDINYLYIPNNIVTIRVLNKEGIEETVVISGNLMNIIDESEKKINEILPNEYPKKPILEALKNAVLYRDYTHINRGIDVVIGYKSIEVMSPGNLLYPKVYQNNFSYLKRNIWLYEKMITLDDDKRFSQGVDGFNIMKKAFYGKGRVKFVNSRIEGIFKVIFPGWSICEN